MTPKEKAEDLLNKMYACAEINRSEAKQCALIAVDEIIIANTVIPYGLEYLNRESYWQEVKQEIEKL